MKLPPMFPTSRASPLPVRSHMLATTKPQAASTTPDELRRRRLTECGCRRGAELLVHGSDPNAIGSVRSCVVLDSFSWGKRFRDLKFSGVDGWRTHISFVDHLLLTQFGERKC